MKYRKKNKLTFDKKIDFEKFYFKKFNLKWIDLKKFKLKKLNLKKLNLKKLNLKKLDLKKLDFKSRKAVYILGGSIIVILFFFLLPKFIRKDTIIIEREEKRVVQPIEIIEPLFLEELNIQVYNINLEKYGIRLQSSNDKSSNKEYYTMQEDRDILDLELVPEHEGISQWRNEELFINNNF